MPHMYAVCSRSCTSTVWPYKRVDIHIGLKVWRCKYSYVALFYRPVRACAYTRTWNNALSIMQIHENSFRYYFATNIPVSIATLEFLTAEQLLERWGMAVLNAVGLVCTSARWAYHLMLSWSENFCEKSKWRSMLEWRVTGRYLWLNAVWLVSCFSTFQRFGGLSVGFETFGI